MQPNAVIVFPVWLKLHMLNDGVASALRELATALGPITPAAAGPNRRRLVSFFPR